MPEWASVPSTSMLTAPSCQPAAGVTVVSTGRSLSILTTSVRSSRLPAASTAAVISWWVPVPLTVAEPLSVHGPETPSRHSGCTGEPESLEASTGTVAGPLRHAVLSGTVVLAGVVESICTTVSTHSVQTAGKLSCARCVNR